MSRSEREGGESPAKPAARVTIDIRSAVAGVRPKSCTCNPSNPAALVRCLVNRGYPGSPSPASLSRGFSTVRPFRRAR